MKKYTIELTADEIRTVISALAEATDRRVEQHSEHTIRTSKFFKLLIVFENKWRDICNTAIKEWQQQTEKKITIKGDQYGNQESCTVEARNPGWQVLHHC